METMMINNSELSPRGRQMDTEFRREIRSFERHNIIIISSSSQRCFISDLPITTKSWEAQKKADSSQLFVYLSACIITKQQGLQLKKAFRSFVIPSLEVSFLMSCMMNLFACSECEKHGPIISCAHDFWWSWYEEPQPYVVIVGPAPAKVGNDEGLRKM